MFMWCLGPLQYVPSGPGERLIVEALGATADSASRPPCIPSRVHHEDPFK